MRPIIWQVVIPITVVLIIFCGTTIEIISSEGYAQSLFNKYSTYDLQPQADSRHHEIIKFLGFGKEPDISFLGPDEQAHMQDVRNVIDVFGILYWGSTILFLFALKMLWQTDRTKVKERLEKAFAYSGIIGICAIAIIALFIITNFNGTFELMHKIFFPQGNWQFSQESTLIQLYSEGFFKDYGTQIITTMLVKLASIIGIILIWKKTKKKNA